MWRGKSVEEYWLVGAFYLRRLVLVGGEKNDEIWATYF